MNREPQVNDPTIRLDFHVGSDHSRHGACLSTGTEHVAPPIFFQLDERTVHSALVLTLSRLEKMT